MISSEHDFCGFILEQGEGNRLTGRAELIWGSTRCATAATGGKSVFRGVCE